jgi:L-rhamnose isomerase
MQQGFALLYYDAFLLEKHLMTHAINVQAIAQSYADFVDAGATYGKAMREAAKKLGGTPCATLLEALAKVHADKFACNYTWNANGSAVFYHGAESTRESRDNNARMSWTRNVMCHFETASSKSNKVVPVQVSKAVVKALQVAMAGLTKAQRSEACKQALAGLSAK